MILNNQNKKHRKQDNKSLGIYLNKVNINFIRE